MKQGTESTINSLVSLIQEVKAANGNVAVCSIPSRTDSVLAFSRAESINNRLFDVCRSHGAEFIDLRGYLVSCRHWLHRDGVHYSENGARIVGDRLGELIDDFLC